MARRALAQIDRPLLALVAAVAVLGLYNLASAGRPLGESLHVKHMTMLGLGISVAIVIASVHYRNLEGLAIPLFVATIALLVITSMFGKIVNGSRRWLVVGPLNVQTSDLAKIAVIIIVARVFHLERWEGGMTLREVFRPLNVSRPLIVVFTVLMISIFGDGLKPPKLKAKSGSRWRTTATIKASTPKLIVGRRKGDGFVRLPYSGVKREHAEIERIDDGHYLIRPLGEGVGTFVNDELVEGERALQHGDVVRFGLNQRALLRFSSSLQNLAPFLPLIAIISAIYLAVAFFLQLRRGQWTAKDIVAPIDVVAIPCVLILIQPDLGTTLVVLLIAFSMILYVGLRPASLFLLFSGGAIGSVFAWFVVLKSYQKQRVLSFLNPTSDLAGAGYHQHQSLIAIGSGEVFGKGHGQGTQTQLSFLPEQQTDFIFSVWAEEQGFLGCAVVVLLFAGIIIIALRIAATARDRFGALLAVGVTALLFWHTVINMLMVLRLAPVVGVPLPLWSNGGSFVLTSMIGLGILMNVSMRRRLF